MFEQILEDEAHTQQCGQQLAQLFQRQKNNLTAPMVVHFKGDIGAGKSCFIRALLKALGVQGRIKSPTFSIIETYQANAQNYTHMDLYRLEDEEELHYLGFEEHVEQADMVLIEWPEKVSFLPAPDLFVQIDVIELGAKRKISIQSISKQAKVIIDALIKK